jgi:glucosamine--fructose-6-phosphate aminotransferase (isomerizing)
MAQSSEMGYLGDILLQPAALEATYASLERSFSLGNVPQRLQAGEFRRILLTGMGSSYSIFYPLFYTLSQKALPVTHIEASELVHYAPELLQEDTLVITASQSGSSAETVRLLELCQQKKSTVVGITNTAGSPLATQADVVVMTEAGVEATVSCKTYVSALLALRWVEAALLGYDLDEAKAETKQAAALVRDYLENWQGHVEFFKQEIKGSRNFFMTGRGLSLAAVGTGSLTVKESTLMHAEGLSCAALRHGPKEMMRSGVFVLAFAGLEKTRRLNKNLIDELITQGAHVLWVDAREGLGACRIPACPEGLLPIMEILPTEMFNLALAAMNGHTAGVFEHASKITNKE